MKSAASADLALAVGPVSTAAVSSYRKVTKQPPNAVPKVKCQSCFIEMDSMKWSKRKKEMIKCTLCSKCYRQSNQRKQLPNSVGGGS